jgi:hypothetical protein
MTTPTPNNILGAWCLLLLCGILYDHFVVGPIERTSPPLGVTAWEVVGGVLFTAVVFGMIAGWEHMLLLLLCFSASGIPMIVGSYLRHHERAMG